jgi:hypothetical protein
MVSPVILKISEVRTRPAIFGRFERRDATTIRLCLWSDKGKGRGREGATKEGREHVRERGEEMEEGTTGRDKWERRRFR